ncbi:hypothetical protein HN011_004028 [Eciton burchellii]|nr:hypothetical protein HN011_004028 [Eciton burchellii]
MTRLETVSVSQFRRDQRGLGQRINPAQVGNPHSGMSRPQVLTSYLLQTREPPWTSYFVRYVDVVNDQRGMSHFNWPAGGSNYHVLRTGCFPYVKYHCSKRPVQDFSGEDRFFKAIKILNLGIPTLVYGLAATRLVRHCEIVRTPRGDVTIYFLLPEDKGSRY